MIKSVLIANRGEIACRIIKTASKLGIKTIAVYSDADRHALHVKLADQAIHIGASPAAESYLDGYKIIDIALQSGAEAIHPGYGFLSENAQFANDVVDAGLIWIGPDASAIDAMGLKNAAKELMLNAGVPVTPGYLGNDQTLETLQQNADQIGYPVLIKAIAGGGGKGMRRVPNSKSFAEALQSCQREAKSVFGNDKVILEKWIDQPRHIEVQIFGDHSGNIVHLFERDCTLQRRHQKVIEEAPAFGMDEATRTALCDIAVKAAKAVNYVGAGTIEFIADSSQGLNINKIWFMEMNTRLQVEHPVTEQITGVDLVEWQFKIASGEPIPLKQDDIKINGWAMEARLYAENPSNGFLPATGKFEHFNLANDCRVDTGVNHSSEVSPFYDPMIAKLIVHAENRSEAILELEKACHCVITWPVHNNAGFLSAVLKAESFRDGTHTTGFLDEPGEALTDKPELSRHSLQKAASLMMEHDKNDPWSALLGFRNGLPSDLQTTLYVDDTSIATDVSHTSIGSSTMLRLNEDILVIESGWPYFISSRKQFDTRSGPKANDGAILSPMPGKIIAVHVETGQNVEKGQALLVIEAMKMEHTISASQNGKITTLHFEMGDTVKEGDLLVAIEKASDSE